MLPQATEQSDELGVSCNGFLVWQEYILYLIVMGSRTQVVNTALLGPMRPLCCVPCPVVASFLLIMQIKLAEVCQSAKLGGDCVQTVKQVIDMNIIIVI